MKDTSTRARIVEAADQLFYQQGYEHTSFAHIAQAVELSRGNFYHHFKSKDELLDAVIAARLVRTSAMLAAWEAKGRSPAERVDCFIQMLIANRVPIRRYGCPVGTLCAELGKLGHPAMAEANGLFTLFRLWLRRQFEELGLGARADALAMHLLARSQGIAALAQAFDDEAFIRAEVRELRLWLGEQLARGAR